jgi:subtilisin family serine protease
VYISFELAEKLRQSKPRQKYRVIFREGRSKSGLHGLAAHLEAKKVPHRYCPRTQSLVSELSNSQFRQLASRFDVQASSPAAMAPPASRAGSLAPLAASAEPLTQLLDVQAPRCWNELNLTGTGIVVAVVDTGVDYEHPDLKARMWNGGSDFPNHGKNFSGQGSENDPMDPTAIPQPLRFHGTKCAGLVVGARSGVSPGAGLMALRISRNTGVSDDIFARDAIDFAVQQGASVISLSQSTPKDHRNHDDLKDWRKYCNQLPSNVFMVASAGNRGDVATSEIPENVGSPGCCPSTWIHPDQPLPAQTSGVCTVGACTIADHNLRADSSRGPFDWGWSEFNDYPFLAGTNSGLVKPDICAPGSLVRTTTGLAAAQPTSLAEFRGTSAATPQVAGCAAILGQACLRSGNPIVSARIQEALEMTAAPMLGQKTHAATGRPVKENGFGSGFVRVFEAYHYGKERGWWQ